MLSYYPAGVVFGWDRDETFAVDGFEITQTDFDIMLLDEGFNELDIESLGYEEIVRQINARS